MVHVNAATGCNAPHLVDSGRDYARFAPHCMLPCSHAPTRGAAQARSRRSVAGKDIMLDPRAGIRRAGALPPLLALLREVVEARPSRR